MRINEYDLLKLMEDKKNLIFIIFKGNRLNFYCVNKEEFLNKNKSEDEILISNKPYKLLFDNIVISNNNFQKLITDNNYKIFNLEFDVKLENYDVYNLSFRRYYEYIEELLFPQEVRRLKDVFISQMKQHFSVENLKNRSVAGVSFLLLDIDEDINFILGRERDGYYTNKFNMIGGKLEQKTDDILYDIFSCLFDEVYEELGIVLNSKSFLDSLIDFKFLRWNSENDSLIFVCYIENFNPNVWNKMMKNRFDKYNFYLPWKYQEMSEIKKIKKEEIFEIMEMDELSLYFLDSEEILNYKKIKDYYEKMNNFVNIKDFESFDKYGI
jgi:hypothetical protein